MARSRFYFLYIRSRGFSIGVLAAAVAAMIAPFVAPRTIPIILTSGDLHLRTVNLGGLLSVLVTSPALGRDLGESEFVHIARLRRCRCVQVFVMLTVILGLAAVTGAASRSGDDALTLGTNALAFLGIVLASAAAPLRLPAWLPALAVAGVTYLAGTEPYSGRARLWAWLLSDDLGTRVAIDVALFVCGAVLFVRSRRFTAAEDGVS